jgi:anti-sigma factor RsiW
MLSCRDCGKYLVAFLDNALELKDHLDIQEHLHSCTPCTNRAEAERALRAFVRQHATIPPLPEHLKQRIIRNAMPPSPSLHWWARLQAPVRLWECLMGMATAATVLLLTLGPFAPLSEKADLMHRFVREASLAYSTYTTQRMPLEVVSADDGIVTQWLNSRMDYHLHNPYITDKATQLLGGRLDHLLGRKSAVLMYQRRDVPVLLFAFKSDQLSLPAQHMIRAKDRLFYVQTVSGRPVVMWQHGGITYSMVGDLDRHDLLQTAATIGHR